MSPLTWAALSQRREMVRAYRSPVVSAFMKCVRLGRAEDAMYWCGVLLRGRAGLPYVSKRLFRSAGEDNLDVWVMEQCEAPLNPGFGANERDLLYAAYLSARGTKWYETPEAREYARRRTQVSMQPHGKAAAGERPFPTAEELLQKWAAALEEGDVDRAFWWIAEAVALEVRLWRFFRVAIERGKRHQAELTQRLAAVLERQHGWLAAVNETNHLKTLVWHLARGPLPSMGREARTVEFDWLLIRVRERLAGEIEAVPAWTRDGIHTRGRDPRFAGNWQGWLNMIAMYERDGVLDPARTGVTLHAEPAPPPRRRRRG